MTIDKIKAQAIIDELKPVLKEIIERHGLETPQMNWKYGAWFELKLSAAALAEGPHGINLGSKEAQYYEQFGYTGLTAPLGTVFTSRGEDFVFAGIAAKRPKYPIYAKNLVEGTYHFFPVGAIALINKAAPATV